MTQARTTGRRDKTRATRTPARNKSPGAALETPKQARGGERPAGEEYLAAFRSVVTPARLRAMAADLVAAFDEQETPLKDKFAVWSRFAAYAIGTPRQQLETDDNQAVEDLLKALLYARESDQNASE